MPWFDIDEDLYNGTLPRTLEATLKELRDSNPDFTGIELCRNFDVAVRLLDYSNRLNNGNELIVVRSEMLADIKGIIEFDEAKVKWLGFDVVALGEWSLLRDGLFASASSFPGYAA